MASLRLICFVLLSLAAVPGRAADDFRVEHLSIEEGVTNSLIWTMYQDSKGFLWFGTMYGLVKYNGYDFITYRHDPQDTTSLSNDDIVSLYEDRQGDLWVGTYNGGLNKLNRRTGRFERYLQKSRLPGSLDNTVWAICEDREGTLWLGTGRGGIDALDKRTGKVSLYSLGDTQAAVVSSIVTDSAGILYAGTRGGGVMWFDTTTRTFRELLPELKTTVVTSLLPDTDGMIWIGTEGEGILRYEKSGKLTRVRHKSENNNSLLSDAVSKILRDKKGRIWVGTQRGVSCFFPANGSYRHFTMAGDEPERLSGTSVVALVEDRSGIIWVGTYNGGIDRILTGKTRFKLTQHDPARSGSLMDNEVTAFLEDREGGLWVGTVKGLNWRAKGKTSFKRFTMRKGVSGNLSGRFVTSIAEDGDGIIWVGTRNGLNRFNRNQQSFSSYLQNRASRSTNVVTALYVDKSGVLWVGSASGLGTYDRQSNTITRIANPDTTRGTQGNDYVLSIHGDSAGYLWVGTYAGLERIDTKSGARKNYRLNPSDATSLSNNYPLTMFETDDGTFWVGTGGGLNRFERQTETFSHYTEKDGLPNSVICGIMEDELGRLWLSTNKGLSLFDVKHEVFRNFDVHDGLPSNLFHPRAALKLKSGEMLFGGVNGFIAFRPESLQMSSVVPPVVINSVTLVDGSRTLDWEFAYRDSLLLAHTENSFTVSYASLDFTQPLKNQYSYRLDGFDEAWHESGKKRTIQYTGLSPGSYTLHVRGTNNDGLWNNEGAVLHVIIRPPFWQTIWFRVLAAVFLFVVVFTGHRLRVRSNIRELERLEEARRVEAEKVRKRAASDFHDELGHRLTKIGLFTQIVKKKLNGSSPEVMKYLNKIIDDAQNLANDTRDFIWTLDPSKDSLFDVVLHLKEAGEEMFDRTGIGFRVNGFSEDLLSIKLPMETRRHVTLIFKEGMHNILKHARCNNVTLTVCADERMLQLNLTDDGQGYEGFEQRPGYGLANMKQRAEKIRSSIRFDSHPGKGTTVELRLVPG